MTQVGGHAFVTLADRRDPVDLAAIYREIKDRDQVSSLVLAASLNDRGAPGMTSPSRHSLTS